MKYQGYKLVRDHIPAVARDDSSLQFERVLDLTSYRQLLVNKMHEEVAELESALSTGNQRSIEEELADVHEVLVALSDTYRCRDVTDLAMEKASRRGGFYQGYVLKTHDS